jgi:hypothetical protein
LWAFAATRHDLPGERSFYEEDLDHEDPEHFKSFRG